jgi:hypothetical protein
MREDLQGIGVRRGHRLCGSKHRGLRLFLQLLRFGPHSRCSVGRLALPQRTPRVPPERAQFFKLWVNPFHAQRLQRDVRPDRRGQRTGSPSPEVCFCKSWTWVRSSAAALPSGWLAAHACSVNWRRSARTDAGLPTRTTLTCAAGEGSARHTKIRVAQNRNPLPVVMMPVRAP